MRKHKTITVTHASVNTTRGKFEVNYESQYENQKTQFQILFYPSWDLMTQQIGWNTMKSLIFIMFHHIFHISSYVIVFRDISSCFLTVRHMLSHCSCFRMSLLHGTLKILHKIHMGINMGTYFGINRTHARNQYRTYWFDCIKVQNQYRYSKA